MDELVAEFITETNESIEELDQGLVTLEQNPNDKDLLSNIFRLVHTIKGTCGFLGLPRLETVAHHAENVLGLFRDGVLEVTPESVTLIFESMDRIKYILSEIETAGSEPEGSDEELIEQLDAVYNRGTGSSDTCETDKEDMELAGEINTNAGSGFNEDKTAGAVEEEENLMEAEMSVVETDKDVGTNIGVEEEINDEGKMVARESAVASQSLRVNVNVIENLMTMVSELVLTRNQLLQILRTHQESDFAAPLQRLNHVVSELQEGVMKTRMQPIGNAWNKLPRIIRDICVDLGKKIDLEMHGNETELDRQVLEMIKDPLTHMVRNSADHGIELPEERKAAGKQETGKIVLNAYHEGGHIIIEISDDGKGLNTERIKAKAIETVLATSEELENMSVQQIQQFIFKAGFSTAENITSVSGRGVGMDVVRNNIEKIGGSIELKSVEGKGSKFLIKIPLTLAIVSALIVESAGERFAIPQLAVRELVKASHSGDNRIEMIKGSPVFRLRDRLLPLVSLRDTLQIATAPDFESESTENDDFAPEDEKEEGKQYIVVTQIGTYNFGIIVDRVYDTEEIVVKPVATILKNIELFSGNTILGDGSVIMILDPTGIAKSTGEIEQADTMDLAEERAGAARRSADDVVTLLLFSAGEGAPKAVPLSLVARLENIKTESIEISSEQMMIQYRGKLMPLVPFKGVTVEGADEKPILVFSDENSAMGLVVDEIIDIVEEEMSVEIGGHHSGLLGSAIINEKATDVIDVGYYLRDAGNDWYKAAHEPFGEEGKYRKRVLLVDDSPFFRNMLTPLLSVAGYEVTTLESPMEALKLCETEQKFDVIVSDIEMPEMSGFEFAEKIKASSQWQDTPLVALSSHATPQDIDRGREAGFEKYVAKFDRDTLLSTLSQTLAENGKAS
jgi:two-component system chemotaxis sensor kinase CheA